jgi:hypothetical protein
MKQRVIHIEPEAPAKPAVGVACNGCGVCCLAEPCPLGMVWSRRRTGACAALQWDGGASLYRCGVLVRVAAGARRGPLWRRPWSWLERLVRRWMGAGQGCDCDWAAATGDGAGGGVASSNALDRNEQEPPHGPW